MSGERTVFTGKSLSGDVHITAEIGGYAPLVTMSFEKDGHQFRAFLSPHSAADLGLMLIAASRSAGGSALLATVQNTQESE